MWWRCDSQLSRSLSETFFWPWQVEVWRNQHTSLLAREPIALIGIVTDVPNPPQVMNRWTSKRCTHPGALAILAGLSLEECRGSISRSSSQQVLLDASSLSSQGKCLDKRFQQSNRGLVLVFIPSHTNYKGLGLDSHRVLCLKKFDLVDICSGIDPLELEDQVRKC